MSIVINGVEDQVCLLKQLIIQSRKVKNEKDFDYRNLEYESSSTLTITNKYFTVQLPIFEAMFDSMSPTHLHSCEGFITIFTNDLDSTQRQPNFLGIQAEDQDIDTRIAVLFTNYLDETPNISSKEDYINWTLDHGFEFIEIDLSSIHQGWDDREKESLPRLMEALESTRWSNVLSPKPKNSSGSEETFISSRDSNIITSISSSIQPGVGNEDTEVNKTVETSDGNEDIVNPFEDVDFGDSSSLLNEFTAMFEEVRRVREEAMSSSLSNEERRKRAETVAIKLSQMMNDFEEEEDSDGDSGGDENSVI